MNPTSTHVVNNATCTYCGCLCDDIALESDGERIVAARRACTLGRAWFFNHTIQREYPAALIDGQPVTIDAAIEAAATILESANRPLVFGLGNSTCESQRAAVRLTEQIGGIIDTHTSLTHGPTKLGGQLVGKVTCTLGEVMNRADLLIYWGTNPIETHPRHLTKFTFTPKGRFVPGGRHDRTMMLVDVRETLSARVADHFLQIRPGADFEVLTALRALVKGQAVHRDRLEASGVTLDQLNDMAGQMKRARFGAFFFGSGLTMTRGRQMNVAALTGLTADLNAFTKFAAIPMRDHGNEAGSDNVLVWLTGYPFAVDFSRGYPRYNPGEFTAVDLLVRKEADAALIIAADPWTTMPQAAIDYLDRIPHIVIDRRLTPAGRAARVHFTTAVPGISTPGTAYRMDKVPLSMRTALRSAQVNDEDVLDRLSDAVLARQSDSGQRTTGSGDPKSEARSLKPEV